MSTKIEFLIKAIEKVQETNRSLDAKAGIIALFESTLLVVAISGFIDTSRLQVIRNLTADGPGTFQMLLSVYFIANVLALISHIYITTRVIFPAENPEDHVLRGDFEPKRLFFLYALDQNRRIQPSMPDYFAKYSVLSEDDIAKEYIFELEKLSFIRKMKSDRLAVALKSLAVLVIWTITLGLLIALSGLVF